MRFFRKIWCKLFHKRYFQWIQAYPVYRSYFWCWKCEEEVK